MKKHVEGEDIPYMKRFVKILVIALGLDFKCELATKHPHVTPNVIFREFSSTNQFRKNSETQIFLLKMSCYIPL